MRRTPRSDLHPRHQGRIRPRHQHHARRSRNPDQRTSAAELERRTLSLYTQAAAYAKSKGVIIADTKFEFGIVEGSGFSGPGSEKTGTQLVSSQHSSSLNPDPRTLTTSLILIDEVLTPDSSRFWPADQYEPGHDQPSFDKQFLRNWLESQPWNKSAPPPGLPPPPPPLRFGAHAAATWKPTNASPANPSRSNANSEVSNFKSQICNLPCTGCHAHAPCVGMRCSEKQSDLVKPTCTKAHSPVLHH